MGLDVYFRFQRQLTPLYDLRFIISHDAHYCFFGIAQDFIQFIVSSHTSKMHIHQCQRATKCLTLAMNSCDFEMYQFHFCRFQFR